MCILNIIPFARPSGPTRTEKLLAYLAEKKSNVEVLYPINELVNAKKRIQLPDLYGNRYALESIRRICCIEIDK